MFRSDRSNNRGWGGTAILVKNDIAAIQLVLSKPCGMESDVCCVDGLLLKVGYRFVFVYRPPGLSAACKVESLLLKSYLLSVSAPNITLIVAGDFNLPNVDWQLQTAPDDGVHDLLLTIFINNDWLQVFAEPTRFNNILDLVLSNNPLLITHYHLTDPLGAGDHDSIIFTISLSDKDGDVSVGDRSDTSASFITWNPESSARAQNYLLSFHWELIFAIASSAEAVWFAFKRILTACIAACACTRKVSYLGMKQIRHDATLKRLFIKKSCYLAQAQNIDI